MLARRANAPPGGAAGSPGESGGWRHVRSTAVVGPGLEVRGVAEGQAGTLSVGDGGRGPVFNLDRGWIDEVARRHRNPAGALIDAASCAG